MAFSYLCTKIHYNQNATDIGVMCSSKIDVIMTEEDIQIVGSNLIHRINTAKVIMRATVTVGEWKPKEHRCHDNVRTLCKMDIECKPIFGWLYADLSEFGFVSFMFHSIIQKGNGDIFDITPTTAEFIYPFIENDLPESDYLKLMDICKDTNKIDVRIKHA
jgi:hypothetical protein